MKRKSLKNFKVLMSFIMLFSIIFNVSLSMIASAYGGTLTFESEDTEWVYIRNASNGKYISALNTDYVNGDEVVLQEGKESQEQIWKVKNHGDNIYSYHTFWDDNFVLALENNSDVNGAKIILKDISGYNSVPECALFLNFSYIPWQTSYFYNMKSFNNGNMRAITYESGSNTLTNSNIKSGLDNSIVQCWVYESMERLTPLMSWNLVDSGGHCDWDSSSKYTSMVKKAASAWNTYIGDEVFRADAWNIIQDVKIKDLDSDPTSGGAFGCTFSSNILNLGENAKYARQIHLYKDTMDDLQSDLQRQKVVMHEMGHALGLEHNRTAKSSNKLGNIMQQGELPYGVYVGLDDKASVKEAYAGF